MGPKSFAATGLKKKLGKEKGGLKNLTSFLERTTIVTLLKYPASVSWAEMPDNRCVKCDNNVFEAKWHKQKQKLQIIKKKETFFSA